MRLRIAFSLGLGWAGLAAAAEVTIGVAAPLGGPTAILGRQVADGARAAAASTTESAVTVSVADDACTAEGGRAAAAKLVQDGARAVIGFLCTEAIEAAMPVFDAAEIPVVTVGVRTDSLTDGRGKTGWPVLRLAPRADAERAAVAAIIPRLWREELFAIVDDGTIYGRELAESVRLAAEQAGLKPVFTDTFRPQLENQVALVGRLRRAGATRVFVGGDLEDVAVMTRDAAALDAGLVFAAGEALRAAPGPVALAPGTIMIGLPDWTDIAPAAALEAVRSRGVVPEGYVLPAFAALQVAEAALRDAGSDAPAALDGVSDRTFQTVIGPVRFDGNGDLAENPYRAFRWDGARFVPLNVP